MATSDLYRKFESRLLNESDLRYLNYPRAVTSGSPCTIKLYGDQYGFTEGHCKRCDRVFDTTFEKREKCNYHTQNSRRYRGSQQPHGCCGGRFGSVGCRSAPSHVHKANWHMDFSDFKRTENTDDRYDIYAVDTESIHTKKGLEVASVTVLDTDCKVLYKEKCLPTTEIIDYNTVWSGLQESDFIGVTKKFAEVQADLLRLFSDKTILVGHGLGSDLMALKIVHDKVVDTLVLYPHPRGRPLKKSLKDLALEQLDRRIQVGDGHDSHEDAEVTMKLALKKANSRY